MAKSLVFMMGEFAAEFPTDRRYARNHMWAQPRDNGVHRFGFSAYAVRLLQDVYFLDWELPSGADVAAQEEIGQIESQKAEASLYAPLSGRLVAFNEVLFKDPSAINVDKYGSGWLFEISGSGDTLLSPEQYLEHLAAVWEVTQRTIKGQLNQ
ncbi:MAG: glycine cleavage system protein H [Pirellulales bacterium]|nr:glycine cleavage system protein H [Pirellulales bacterium]